MKRQRRRTRGLHERAFAAMQSPPPSGSIQFFDGEYPALPADTYTIQVEQTLAPGVEGQQQVFTASQPFTVQAPEFSIDATIVQSVDPPVGGSSVYSDVLPSIVLTDPALPWERALVPNTRIDPSAPLPWLALLVFAEGEVILQPGSSTPFTSTTAGAFANPPAGIVAPHFPAVWVAANDPTPCQIITVKGSAFTAVAPQISELPHLAHCRAINTTDEPQVLLSVVLSNRLPQANGAVPVRYYASLVSLEGFASYLTPADPLPIPATDDVQLISLYGWTFTSQPQALDFAQYIDGLVASQTPNASLTIPFPSSVTGLPAQYLGNGYAPLTFVSGSGEETFAWYRGPFTAAMPQPLPSAVTWSATADALMIYLADQGLFDLSYAAAWNIGRNLALADARFAQALMQTVSGATDALITLSRRMAMPHLRGETDVRALLARDASRRRFASLMADGLGGRWTEALESVRRDGLHAGAKPPRRARIRPPHPRELLARADVRDAIRDAVADPASIVGDWLANLVTLEPVPFSHLVPDPAMLPVESLRFFYVDPSWLDALQAGAISIAVNSSSDAAVLAALQPLLVAETAVTAGMLIRSQLVSVCPELVVTASVPTGAPVSLIVDSTPSPVVRLCLFDQIPGSVVLAQPYQGLRFGVEDENAGLQILPRAVTAGATPLGALIPDAPPVSVPLVAPAADALGGVVDLAKLTAALTSATGCSPLGPGNFAIQLVQTPQSQSFPGVPS